MPVEGTVYTHGHAPACAYPKTAPQCIGEQDRGRGKNVVFSTGRYWEANGGGGKVPLVTLQ